MKDQINAVLRRATGYQLQKAAPAEKTPGRPRKSKRVLKEPAFVISTVRSGSTLLRVLLDSHSQIHAPHETHLRDIRVELKSKYAERALKEVRLSQEELQAVLWDWYLGRELARAGKPLLVNKTPSDVYIIDEIKAAWPDARFIFLLRHPLAIARSRHKLRNFEDTDERNWQMVNRYANAVEEARQAHEGLTVRYEDLAADPARVTKELCAFLGVEWESSMLDYGDQSRRFRAGLGDWSDQIKSGQVQPPAPLPTADEVPEALRPIAATWGYLEAAPQSG